MAAVAKAPDLVGIVRAVKSGPRHWVDLAGNVPLTIGDRLTVTCSNGDVMLATVRHDGERLALYVACPIGFEQLREQVRVRRRAA